MRVTSDRGPPRAARSPGRADFAEALARARRAHDDVERGRLRDRAEIRRADLDRERAAVGERSTPGCGSPRAEVAEADGPGARAERVASPEAPRAASVAAEPAPDYAPEVRSPELRAMLRAVPFAVEAGRVRDGTPALELAFGQALSVEIRGGARGGVDLVLRPDAALARSASAELPALVRALRARGVLVGRAEVRARAGGRAGRAR